MRINWFRSHTPRPDSRDSMGALIEALASIHDIEVITASTAHDVVWRWHRGAIDLAVYELDGTHGGAFMWPYLVRYPGLAVVLSRKPATGHTASLRRRRKDSDLETAFARTYPSQSLAIPLACSRAVALPHGGSRRDEIALPDRRRLCSFAPAMARPVVGRLPHDGPLRVGLVAPDERCLHMMTTVVARLREGNTIIAPIVADSPVDVLASADVIVSTAWPPTGGCADDVLAAMSLGIPAVVMESTDTAGWPSVNPQTWQPRETGPDASAPICVSLDPRDEEHSLMLALRRLATDVATRARLGTAAQAQWTRLHAPNVAATAFEAILAAAHVAEPPTHPANWPAHFSADASRTARRILDEFGLGVDVLR